MSQVEEPVRGVESPGDGQEPSVPVGEVERMNGEGAVALAPELVANTLSEYVRGWWVRVRGGETGVLPVIVGLLIIGIIFQVQNDNFLSSGNLVNLLVQAAVFMLLGMAEVFGLLLGEIVLSIGFIAGLGGTVAAELVKVQTGWPWWAAIIVGLLSAAAIGALQGTIITRLGLPSFVVTLAGLLGWQGVLLIILGQGGTLPINDAVINDLANGNLTVVAGWILLAVAVGGYASLTWLRDTRRRTSGLVAPPVSITVLKIVVVASFGVVLVLICNSNRGALVAIRGMPWVVPIVLGVLGMWSFLLGRTKFGRYMYAVGGNPEAARRAGVNLALIRTVAFTLAGFTAGVAGLI